MRPVELFHLGPQKSGTSWVYRALREHPEVACPPRDSVHYFDMFYARGRSWYAHHFREAGPEQRLFDPTPSYLRSPWAPARIARENPRARLVVCLRHPVERAFSHYWHERKKGKIRFRFEEVLENYDLFASWLETGFYAQHLERYLAHFPREQILVQRFEQLERDPEAFLKELLRFFGLREELRPRVLHRPVNRAGPRREPWSRAAALAGRALERAGLLRRPPAWLTGRAEYERGVPPPLRRELLALCRPEVRRLEALLGLDLRSWREEDAGEGGAC